MVAVRGDVVHDSVPQAVPEMVVRLQRRASPLRRACHRLLWRSDRQIPVNRRRSERPPRRDLPQRPDRSQSRYATGEVVPGYSALLHSGVPMGGGLRCHRRRVDHRHHHRSLPARAVQLRGGGPALVMAGPGIRLCAGNGQVPAVQLERVMRVWVGTAHPHGGGKRR